MLLNRQAEIEALGEGSTGQTELARAILGALQATFPPSRLISAFFDCAHVAHGKIEANVQNSFALARIRDTLLPKLISGELRIPDAERLLEEAGV
jgi:type I restriction enzyme S subunit